MDFVRLPLETSARKSAQKATFPDLGLSLGMIMNASLADIGGLPTMGLKQWTHNWSNKPKICYRDLGRFARPLIFWPLRRRERRKRVLGAGTRSRRSSTLQQNQLVWRAELRDAA